MAIEVIDKIVQKNGGKFPLMDAKNVVCEDNKTVEERLNDYGADGKDGVGVKSVEQTTASAEDGGINVMTITLSDGSSSTFQVKNGAKGSNGEKGETGESGKDGSDGKSAYAYAQDGGYTGTEEEFAEMLALVASTTNAEEGAY